VWRPLGVALGAAVVLVLRHGLPATRATFSRLAAGTSPRRAAIALALVTTGVSLALNSWTASGPDSFAYVSQAALWRSGTLEMPVPLAATAPWPEATTTFAPFGYRAAPDNAPALVPVTAPGVPMLMASFQAVFGHCGAFLVTPLSGGLLVLLTFAIGTRLGSPAACLTAAWLVATSPSVLFMLMWPMTDIPAAACAALVIWLLAGTSARDALAGGLSAAAGVLLRPNFILIAAAAGAWLLVESLLWAGRAGRWRRPLYFALAVMPGVALSGWLNVRWYGAAAASGYGAAGDLLSAGHVWTNVVQFSGWLAASSPLGFLGLSLLAWPRLRAWSLAGGPRAATLLGITTGGALSVYLFYEPFTEWWFLRFLLPAWPAVFVATGIAIETLRSRSGRVAALVTLLVVGAGLAGVVTAANRGVFRLGEGERRYVDVARIVAQYTEPRAVILTSMHSGTVRYYAGRETLRYDVLDPAWLDRAIDWLASQGRQPYILVEDWEQPRFDARFAAGNRQGALSYPPLVAWQSAHVRGWTWLYDPLRRDRPTERPGADFEPHRAWCAPPAPVDGR